MKRVLPLAFALAASFAAADARAQNECAASCTTTASNRCGGTQACVCKTSPHWSSASLPVKWYLYNHTSLDGISFTALQSEVSAAFAAWTQQSCTSYATSYQGAFTTSTPNAAINPNDGKNQLAWINQNWGYGSGTLGVTHGVWSSGSNYMFDADIEFNDYQKTWSTTGASGTLDVRSIATHEGGHFWGAVHTPNSGAVMYYAYSGGLKRTPNTDDVNQLCCLYPGTVNAGSQGTFCTQTSNCQTGLICAKPAVGGDLICTVPCTPGTTVCPTAFSSCESAITSPTGGAANACFIAPSSASDLCAFCASGPTCSSGLCLNAVPYGFCSSGCSGPGTQGDRQCGVGYACVTIGQTSTDPGTNVCIPTQTATNGGRVCPAADAQCSSTQPCPAGFHCDSNNMCKGGGVDEVCDLQNYTCDSSSTLCVGDPNSDLAYCRRTCTTTACAAGYTCYGITGSTDKVCIPDQPQPGPDAGTPGPDASTAGPDAGTAGPDAAAAGPDAATNVAAPCGVCDGNTPCPTGYSCLSTNGVNGICHQGCTSNAGCNINSSCTLSTGTAKFCACPSEVAGRDQPCGSGTGKTCAQTDVCVSGVGSTDARCRQACTANAQCPSNDCAALTGGGGVCMPPATGLDAGAPGPDASTTVRPDASTAGQDASTSVPPDGSLTILPGPDASTGQPGADASGEAADAGGSVGTGTETGCGCQTGGGEGAFMLALAFLGLGGWKRRREPQA